MWNILNKPLPDEIKNIFNHDNNVSPIVGKTLLIENYEPDKMDKELLTHGCFIPFTLYI